MAISTYNDLTNLIEAWWPENAVLSGSNVTSLPGTHNSKTLAVVSTPQIVNAGLPSGSKSISLSGVGPYMQILSANMVSGTTFTFMAMTKLVSAISTDNDRVYSFNATGLADWNNVSGAVFHPFSAAPRWPDGFRNSAQLPNAAVISADVWHLFLGIFDGTNFTSYTAVSGATGWTQAATGAVSGTFDIDEFTIGADRGGGSLHSMEFGDVVWYTDAKGSTDRDDLWALANTRNFTGYGGPTYHINGPFEAPWTADSDKIRTIIR